MTKFILISLLGLLLPAVGQADLYVKKATRSTSYVEGEVAGISNGDVTEMWIGDGRIASHEGNKTILLDLEKDWFCILNHPEKSFVETSLPLEVTEVLEDGLLSRYERVYTSGKVRKEDRRREMISRECREYKVSYWDVSDEQKINERTVTVWATEDVDFDKKAYSRMLDCMRMLHNRDKKLRKELKKIKGLQTGYEIISNGSGVESRLSSEVVEIRKMDSPPAAYSVPEGYTKKERLNDRDF